MNDNEFREFIDAIDNRDAATFDRLLSQYPEFALDTRPALPPLGQAASSGQPAFVDKLLKAGSNPETFGLDGGGVLICAVDSGSIDTVALLLNHGAKMTATDHGTDPMFAAIVNGHVDIARLLLDYGYDPTIEHGKPREEGSHEPPWNALTFAIARGQTEIAEAIVTRSQHPIPNAADIIERTSEKFFPADEEEVLDSKAASYKVDIQSMALFDALHRKYPLFEFRSGEREAGLPALLAMPVVSGPRECWIEPADGTEKLLSDAYRKRWPQAMQLERRAVQQAVRMMVESGYGFVQSAVDANPDEELLTACRMLSKKYARHQK